jgi:hypothetical protein
MLISATQGTVSRCRRRSLWENQNGISSSNRPVFTRGGAGVFSGAGNAFGGGANLERAASSLSLSIPMSLKIWPTAACPSAAIVHAYPVDTQEHQI